MMGVAVLKLKILTASVAGAAFAAQVGATTMVYTGELRPWQDNPEIGAYVKSSSDNIFILLTTNIPVSGSVQVLKNVGFSAYYYDKYDNMYWSNGDTWNTPAELTFGGAIENSTKYIEYSKIDLNYGYGERSDVFDPQCGPENLHLCNYTYDNIPESWDLMSIYLNFNEDLVNSGESISYRLIIGDYADRLNYIPEPASWAMMILGFGIVGSAVRRRQSVAVA